MAALRQDLDRLDQAHADCDVTGFQTAPTGPFPSAAATWLPTMGTTPQLRHPLMHRRCRGGEGLKHGGCSWNPRPAWNKITTTNSSFRRRGKPALSCTKWIHR